MSHQHKIYTIGHSTRDIDDFIRTLLHFKIQTLVDIRRFPGSRKYPAYNAKNLENSLSEHHIKYIQIEHLGGRRSVMPNSTNTVWHNKSFQGYADYMETTAFQQAVVELEQIAIQHTTVYMCAEAVWWRCHRAMVSDYLKSRGWMVIHILSHNHTQEHPYTKPAHVEEGKLQYR